jgi:glycerophosphoryl diester phosphodiesterase
MLRRRLVALVVLALLPFAPLLQASPAAAKDVRVSAPRVVGPLPIGSEALTLSGSVGKSVKRKVQLQLRKGGGWRVVARKWVGPKGRYTFRVTMPGLAANWRVLAPPIRKHGKSYARRISRVRTVYSAIQTAYASPARSVKVGTPVTIPLTFAPARPGRRVSVQVNEGGGWRNLANLTENAAGRASYRYTPTKTGMVQVRALATAFHGARAVAGPSAALAVLRTEPVQVAAHRGASLNNPENTVSAIKNAVKLGADWIELDVRALKPDTVTGDDGTVTEQQHFILMHDPTFQRTTNIAKVYPGRRTLGTAQFTWPEVQKLDAGSWKAARFTNSRVPDLALALAAIDSAETQYNRQVRVILEFKGDRPAMMAALYDQVKELRPDWISADGHDDKVVFMSFDYATVFSALQTGDRAADGPELAGVMDNSADPAYDWLSQMHVLSTLASASVLGRVHATVPDAAVWTVDSPAAILSAATNGADIVTTDDIATARSVLLR